MKTLILPALLLVACDKGEPAAPTAAQSAQLNEAEDLLNAEAGNEKGPEANGTPSK